MEKHLPGPEWVEENIPQIKRVNLNPLKGRN